MNDTIDMTAIPVWVPVVAGAVFFLAAVGLVFLGVLIIFGVWSLRTTRVTEPDSPASFVDLDQDEKPAPQSEPEVEPAPVEEAHAAAVEVAVPVAAEVIIVERPPAPDLLPPPPPHASEVPIFRQLARLPQCDSYGFRWQLPADPYPTGALPIVVLDDFDGYRVQEIPPRQHPGFEVDEQKARDRFPVLTTAEMSEAADKLAAKRKSRAKVDVTAGTVVLP